MRIQTKVRGVDGKPIILNEMESALVEALRHDLKRNSLGAEVDITTLTGLVKSVTDQKFYEVKPSDYMPVSVGEGAWDRHLTTFRSFFLADDFEKGILDSGKGNARLASADAAVDSLTIDIINWGKEIGYSLIELRQASKTGVWDLVMAKEESRKKNWDLGIQKVAFWGTSDGKALGLLNQSITPNTAVITKSISAMSASEFKLFLGGDATHASLLGAYRSQNGGTAWPSHFEIPESDFLGLAACVDETYPLKTKLERLSDSLKLMTSNAGFKILPVKYSEEENAYNSLDVNRYVLLNYDPKSIRMDIPVDYTNTLANTINGFNFNSVGYGQFTGVLAYRPKELMYFDYDK